MKFLRIAALTCAAVFCAVAAQGATLSYTAILSAANEEPPVASLASGTARVDYDDSTMLLRVRFSFQDFVGGLSAAHIHGPTTLPGSGNAGVMTTTPSFPGLPSGAMSGSYDESFDLTMAGSFNPAFIAAKSDIAGARAALLGALAGGQAYLNLHSTFAPAGEARGFLTEDTAAPIPLPAGLPLALGALGLLAFTGRRRR